MRRLLVITLLAISAGCAGAPAASGPSPPAPAPTTFVAALESGIAEPSLAILPDGNVTIVAIHFEAVSAWRGPARGGAFASIAAPEGSGDTDLAQSGGVLHHVGLGGRDARIAAQRSLDGGATWTEAIELAAEVGGVDRPWIAAAGERVVVAWASIPIEAGLFVGVSDDGGASWSAPYTYAQGATGIGDVAIDPADGRMYLSWSSADNVLHVSASDDGVAWEDVAAAPIGSYSFSSLAVDGAGTVYAVWSAPLDGRGNVPRSQGEVMTGVRVPFPPTRAYLSVSSDRGSTWSAPLDLTAEGTSAMYPAVAAGRPGRVAIAWYEVPLGSSDGTGKLALAVSDDAAAATPGFARIDPTPDPVALGLDCETQASCSTNRNVGEVLEVAMRPDGAPAVAWVQSGSEGVEIHYASPSGAV